MKHVSLLTLSLTLLLALCTSSHAHKVRIFAWEEGDDIVTESKFSGGRAARNVAVSVIDSATGKELLTGTTDSGGLFRFPVPQNRETELEIVVDGGDGHKSSWKHLPAEGSQGMPAPAEAGVAPSTPVKGSQETIDTAQLTILIDEALERKLGPIRRILAENTERTPSLQDIIGGVGYIFGLAGIAAYMRFRKKNKE
jgi:nickel transport protein